MESLRYNFYLKLLNSVVKGWVREYRFNPRRRWRADFAHPELKILAELEGGIWIRGRHTRGEGYINDMEKYNSATVLGYKVLRYTPEQMDTGRFIFDIMQIQGSMKGV